MVTKGEPYLKTPEDEMTFVLVLAGCIRYHCSMQLCDISHSMEGAGAAAQEMQAHGEATPSCLS